MADGTRIEWTDATWNPIVGCSVVSAGCRHCYAMRLAGTRLRHHPTRKGLTDDTKAGPVWNGQVRFNDAELVRPLSWRRPRRIFVCAHGDLFHEAVPAAWIDKVFAIMALCRQHSFQVLTKRPERARAYLSHSSKASELLDRNLVDMRIDLAVKEIAGEAAAWTTQLGGCNGWPLDNVWLGVSVEDQETANERIPYLLSTPAALYWISAEPLLGPVDLKAVPWGHAHAMLRIGWVVTGGESGPGARPMHPDWARSLRDQCAAAGVPFLFKQWGEWAPADPDMPSETQESEEIAGRLDWPMHRVGKNAAGRLLDGVLHDGFPEVRHG